MSERFAPPCWQARRHGTRSPAGRCSPSGCTSSCPRATPSTSRSKPRRDATSPQYQVTVPDRPSDLLLPLGFCRECGQEYLVVAKTAEGSAVSYRPAATATPAAVTKSTATSTSRPTSRGPSTRSRRAASRTRGSPTARSRSVAARTCPAASASTPTGTEVTTGGHRRSLRSRPVPVLPALRGLLRAGPRQRLRQAGHPGRRGPELSRLVDQRLDRARPRQDSRRRAQRIAARKLLTFVDNRQDASLQAGHFNDFVQVAQLRGAVSRAVAAQPLTASPRDVAQRVVEAWACSSRTSPPTRRRCSEHGGQPSGRSGRSSSTACTSTCSAAGGSRCPTSSRPACCASATSPDRDRRLTPHYGQPATRRCATPEPVSEKSCADPARRVPSGARHRRRLPDRRRLRPAQAAVAISICVGRGRSRDDEPRPRRGVVSAQSGVPGAAPRRCPPHPAARRSAAICGGASGLTHRRRAAGHRRRAAGHRGPARHPRTGRPARPSIELPSLPGPSYRLKASAVRLVRR